MSIVFIQTSDADIYHTMLLETSKTVKNYCRARGISYIQFVGLKAGNMPWHASYNRIFMLKELLDQNFRGWAFYLDSDSYIVDYEFDIDLYLSDKGAFAGIFSGYLNGVSHNINSGGFAINFSHPTGRQLVRDYYDSFLEIGQAEFDRAIYWEVDVPEDQLLLHRLLDRYLNTYNLGEQILIESFELSYVNNGPFIAQALRSKYRSLSDRLLAIRNHISSLPGPNVERDGLDDMAVAAFDVPHPRIYTDIGVNDHASIHTAGERGGNLIYGPYMRMEAGRYVFNVRGAAVSPGGIHQGEIACDVVFGEAGKIAAKTDDAGAYPAGRFSVELPFSLEQRVDDLEGRVYVAAGPAIRIFSVRFLRSG